MAQNLPLSDEAFHVVSPFEPAGDQPQAIDKITTWLAEGAKRVTVLGVTGSGKTYVMAKVMEKLNRPVIVMSHNKTLTAQLFHEFRQFFPENAVEYFVSYYDYYQPEAYIASSGTYIEKDSSINEEIDRLRHRATAALFSRKDCLVVASVSCIYGLGSPEAYTQMSMHLEVGQKVDRDLVISGLVETQYERNDMSLARGKFRARGELLEVWPTSSDTAVRVEFNDDEVDSIREVDPLTGATLRQLPMVTVFPAQHYMVLPEQRANAIHAIEAELDEQVKYFKANDRAIEAQRIYERTMYDLEMMREIGYCKGIENYSRPLSGRPPGSPPETLLHYLPKDAVLFIDESHVTLPQVQGMFRGDRARKEALVNFGFRLPSAYDNRPLTFDEFDALPQQKVYISATPSDLERKQSKDHVAELIVRPTGLIDPAIELRPISNQVDDLIGEINKRAGKERVLVTTLTKRMAEDLTSYLLDAGIKVRYMHSEIVTLERMEIVREFRLGVFDCLVGINLLREGLDIPECSLVAVLDADKEGFLRSTTSLIQTCGRAARNENGRVILYADVVTESIAAALAECDRRRVIQEKYNLDHGVTPKTIVRAVPESMQSMMGGKEEEAAPPPELLEYSGSPVELPMFIAKLREEIGRAISEERYEDAIPMRDRIYQLEKELEAMEKNGPKPRPAQGSGTMAGRPGSSGEKGRGTRRTGERNYKTALNSKLSGPKPSGGGRRKR